MTHLLEWKLAGSELLQSKNTLSHQHFNYRTDNTEIGMLDVLTTLFSQFLR